MKKKRHSHKEIAAKLRQAESMAAEGKRQSEIVRALRISAMTYHRWRKAYRAPARAPVPAVIEAEHDGAVPAGRQSTRAQELELENLRLRRLVTDLLLEKIRLEEALQARRPALESIKG
jgi:putative transposase